MLTIQNAIDGRKVTSVSSRVSAVYNPATGEQIAGLPLSSKAEVDAAVAIAYTQLAATAWGLATCWIGAFDDEGVARANDLPTGQQPVAMLPDRISCRISPTEI